MTSQPDHERPLHAHRTLFRALIGVTASLSLVVAAVSAYAYVGYLQAQAGITRIPNSPVPSGSDPQHDFGPCVDNVCNYLILGSDSRAGLSPEEQVQFGTNADIGGSQRSDVIMLVHTDPKLQKAIVLSFPRDLWVNIPGMGMDKINAAFSGGLAGFGAQRVAKTVEQLTGLKINHVLYVDLAGFQGIVDTLGGVTMCIPTAMTDPLTGLDVKAGCQTLNGYQALAYVRTRHQPCDLVPDFARIGRQQQFLRAVLNRLLSPGEIAKAPSLIRPVARNLVADQGFDLADVVYLVKQLEGISTGAVEFRAVPGVGATEGSLDVVLPDPVAGQIFARIRQGKPLGDLGQNLAGTAPSEANIIVPVVDHDSAGTAAKVEQILNDAGFDIISRDRRLRHVRRRCEGVRDRVQGRTPERRRGRAEVLPEPPAPRGESEHVEGEPGGGLHHGGFRPAAGGQRWRLDELHPVGILMRALILAGGEGSRLRPITHTNAKQLIPIAGAPILFHALEAIRDAGITEVGIVIGQTGDEIRTAVGDGSTWGLSVSYISQEAPLGLAHAVMTARDFVAGQPFLMYLGDNVLLEGLKRFVEEFERTRPDAQIFLARVPEPERFGVAVLDGDRVVRLVEKPTSFVSDLALVGVYLFDDSILEAADTLEPSARGEYEITEAIQWLIDHGKIVRAEMVSAWWKDTGRPADLLEANRVMLSIVRPGVEGDVDDRSTLEGSIRLAVGAKVIRSELRGPVAIGPGAVIEDSVVGPNVSVERDVRIMRSSVEDSIVMEGCQIVDVHGLATSILGRNVEVLHSGAGGVHRLVVGDQSRVELY